MQIITATEDLQVKPIGYQLLHQLVYLFRLLWLASPLRKNNISIYSALQLVSQVTLIPDQARLLRMLQIIPVTLGNLTVYCLLHPNQLVDHSIAILVEQLESEFVLVIDYPNKQETVCLQLVKRKVVQDVVVSEGRVVRGNTSGRVSRRQDPWGVHRDDVEHAATVLHLSSDEFVKETFPLNVGWERDAELLASLAPNLIPKTD